MPASARRRRKRLPINPLFDIVSGRSSRSAALLRFRCTRARRFCAFDRSIKYLPAGHLPRRECRGLIEADRAPAGELFVAFGCPAHRIQPFGLLAPGALLDCDLA